MKAFSDCTRHGRIAGVMQVGVFKAGFLVVTSLEHPYNNLGDLQRAKWSPTAASLLGTLDIGCVMLHVHVYIM